MRKTVKHELDLGNPPRLTERQRAELEKLGATPDSEIDYSDIPELDEDFWRDAVRIRITGQ